MKGDPKHCRPSAPSCPGSSLMHRATLTLLSPPLPYPYQHTPPEEAHSRGIFIEWERPEGKDFSTDYMSGVLEHLLFFPWWFIQGSWETGCWERCRCLPKLWSGLYNIVLIYAWKPPHSLPLCHLSPKPREEDYIVPGNYMSMKSFFLTIKLYDMPLHDTGPGRKWEIPENSHPLISGNYWEFTIYTFNTFVFGF